jgi:hypothetical protein
MISGLKREESWFLRSVQVKISAGKSWKILSAIYLVPSAALEWNSFLMIKIVFVQSVERRFRKVTSNS